MALCTGDYCKLSHVGSLHVSSEVFYASREQMRISRIAFERLSTASLCWSCDLEKRERGREKKEKKLP